MMDEEVEALNGLAWSLFDIDDRALAASLISGFYLGLGEVGKQAVIRRAIEALAERHGLVGLGTEVNPQISVRTA